MISNPIFFYISSLLIVIFALISLFAHNVIYALLSSIMVFFSCALIFFILGSEYNAIIQIAIYGLAMPIIIGISIMFTNKSHTIKKNLTLSYITLLASGIFLLAFVWLIKISLTILPNMFNKHELINIGNFDVFWAFAKGIFINHVWAFELVSFLLVIITAGISLLSNSIKGEKHKYE